MSSKRLRFYPHFPLLLVLGCSIITQALPLNCPLSPNPPNIISTRQESDQHNAHQNWGCPFSGNSDLYGLGIRLGVYLQLLSTLLANALLSDALREDARNTNAIIMIAIFAGMCSATIKNQINAIEIFIMSTLLMSFLWSDFTPSHISSLVLFDQKRKTIRERMRWSTKKRILSSLGEYEAEDGKMPKVENKPYFAAISRSVFGTAIALYNLWYWLYGRHALLRHDISSSVCIPIVFLETQVELGDNQALFYVIFAVIYAVYEVLFMAWWVYALAPGTLRLMWELGVIAAASVRGCKCATAQMSVKAKVAKWYLEFAKLDGEKLRVFERLRISRVNQERLRNLRFLVMWFGLPAGYMATIWAALAIELTLAWNNVSGIYVLGSTGQLIPFVVGVLGLLRNVHLIAVKLSEKAHAKKEEAKEIRVEWETGAYVYEVGSERELKLEAARPQRRWSIDSGLVDLGKEKDSLGLSRESTSTRSCGCKTE